MKPQTITCAGETHVTARCAECLFGRKIALVDVVRGDEGERRAMCECHVARPTKWGWPVVRMDDFCALHVDAKTHERTFAGLTQGGAQ